jgi:hypothetical protein
VLGAKDLWTATARPRVTAVRTTPWQPLRCPRVRLSRLTSDSHDYGMTFISDAYVRSNWSQLFSIEDITVGGIHDFQDIVVLKRL